ncbi:MAG: glycoside hydrolase family 88 protein [Alistipes sp.]
MKHKILPVLGFLFLAMMACGQKNTKLSPIEQGLDVASFQLKQSAAAFDSSALFPRSWKEGKFRAVDAYDWTSGFFPGSLWLAYQLTQDEQFRTEAEKYTARLSQIPSYKDTHDLGFMVFCSYGQQQTVEKDSISAAAIVEASKSLISRFDEKIGAIRSWNFGAWNYPVIIDNMMNLEMLFWASEYTGDAIYADVAIRHADKTLQNHFRDDNSSYHVISYNDDGTVESKGTFQGYSDSSAWARGQAWGLYGYTMCYRKTGFDRYLDQAQKIADYLIHQPNTPSDRIPYWDYDAPDIPNAPRDASAAAVMASALFELSTMVEGECAKSYYDYAETLLQTLCSESYLAKKGENGGFILMHCVGHLPANSEIDVPLNYGDYYYLEAIQRWLKFQTTDASKK